MAFFHELARRGIKRFRGALHRGPQATHRDVGSLKKAHDSAYAERFREVISDPLNLLIERDPRAGYVDESGRVFLHHGLRVPLRGVGSYYETFSDLLIYNRGVHEPLEEFCFQTLLRALAEERGKVREAGREFGSGRESGPESGAGSGSVRMLELGALWAHYSMWLKSRLPEAQVYMVEPDEVRREAGIRNFAFNGLEGEFMAGRVGQGLGVDPDAHAIARSNCPEFSVDGFMEREGVDRLTLVHCDIQGNELEMLEGARRALEARTIDFLFVSTHGRELHEACAAELQKFGYAVEVDSEPDTHATAYDGFLLGTSPEVAPLFDDFRPLGRVEIANGKAEELVAYVQRVMQGVEGRRTGLERG